MEYFVAYFLQNSFINKSMEITTNIEGSYATKRLVADTYLIVPSFLRPNYNQIPACQKVEGNGNQKQTSYSFIFREAGVRAKFSRIQGDQNLIISKKNSLPFGSKPYKFNVKGLEVDHTKQVYVLAGTHVIQIICFSRNQDLIIWTLNFLRNITEFHCLKKNSTCNFNSLRVYKHSFISDLIILEIGGTGQYKFRSVFFRQKISENCFLTQYPKGESLSPQQNQGFDTEIQKKQKIKFQISQMKLKILKNQNPHQNEGLLSKYEKFKKQVTSQEQAQQFQMKRFFKQIFKHIQPHFISLSDYKYFKYKQQDKRFYDKILNKEFVNYYIKLQKGKQLTCFIYDQKKFQNFYDFLLYLDKKTVPSQTIHWDHHVFIHSQDNFKMLRITRDQEGIQNIITQYASHYLIADKKSKKFTIFPNSDEQTYEKLTKMSIHLQKSEINISDF